VHEISTVSGRVEGSSIELMQVFKRGAGKLQATGFMPENLVKPGQLRSLLENVNGKSS
jgi:hypothetical protein